MISQLSLFDMATTEIGSFYKPGDWVKIRKVPAIARHVRCGHTYKIHSVDPTNGLLEFWNPFAGQWDHLYPNEVKLALVSGKYDSPTPAEVAVGESNYPPSEIDTLSVAGAVGESKLPAGTIDSPTPAEVGVGESMPSQASDDDDTDYFLNPISTYTPRGTARGGKYYRLSYKEGGKVKQVHIRGGNTDSPIAQAKVQEVRSLLAAGMPPAEIATMLRKSEGFKL